MIPPGIERAWDDNDWWSQALLLEYEMIRQYEENEILEATMSVPRLF